MADFRDAGDAFRVGQDGQLLAFAYGHGGQGDPSFSISRARANYAALSAPG
jgi:hypothetical protein